MSAVGLPKPVPGSTSNPATTVPSGIPRPITAMPSVMAEESMLEILFVPVVMLPGCPTTIDSFTV